MLDFLSKILNLDLFFRAFNKKEWKTDLKSLKLLFFGLPLGVFLIWLVLYLFFPLPFEQNKVVGLEINNPCKGVIGLRRVRFTETTISEFESLSHNEVTCFFAVKIK